MAPDLLIGLWATLMVIGLSASMGFLLCWLGDSTPTSYV